MLVRLKVSRNREEVSQGPVSSRENERNDEELRTRPVKASERSRQRRRERVLAFTRNKSGVILDFTSHVNMETKAAFLHLRHIAEVHAFISSRFDFCDAFFTSTERLQLIQNSDKTLNTESSSLQFELHWLPVSVRTELKEL